MIHAPAALALASALARGPAAWSVTTAYQNPPAPYAVYAVQRDRGELPAPTRWELRETLRESGIWDLYR